jgi:hypothetical protein
MSRGGRGGRGRGRGRGGGAFGPGGVPPMGLTLADIQSISREATALYPVLRLTYPIVLTLTHKSARRYTACPDRIHKRRATNMSTPNWFHAAHEKVAILCRRD